MTSREYRTGIVSRYILQRAPRAEFSREVLRKATKTLVVYLELLLPRPTDTLSRRPEDVPVIEQLPRLPTRVSRHARCKVLRAVGPLTFSLASPAAAICIVLDFRVLGLRTSHAYRSRGNDKAIKHSVTASAS